MEGNRDGEIGERGVREVIRSDIEEEDKERERGEEEKALDVGGRK